MSAASGGMDPAEVVPLAASSWSSELSYSSNSLNRCWSSIVQNRDRRKTPTNFHLLRVQTKPLLQAMLYFSMAQEAHCE